METTNTCPSELGAVTIAGERRELSAKNTCVLSRFESNPAASKFESFLVIIPNYRYIQKHVVHISNE